MHGRNIVCSKKGGRVRQSVWWALCFSGQGKRATSDLDIEILRIYGSIDVS